MTATEDTGPPPLEIGVTPWLGDWSGSAHTLAGQAEVAERLGFHSFWLPESHFTGSSANPAPLLRLAALAARTTRLLLGTTSYLLPVRHPLHVAAEVATLDCLSQGRVILGVGRGFRPALFRAFDVASNEKRDIFEAALAQILSAWRGEPIPGASKPGEPPVTLSPLPVQKPHPPIWLAGFGPKAMAQVGRLGLPYLASPLETQGELLENTARQRAARGPDFDGERLAVPIMRTTFVARDPALVERVRDALRREAAAMAAAPLARLRRHAQAELDDWALVGDPDFVAERVTSYREKLGMTHLVARVQVPGAGPEAIEESVALLAKLPR